MVFNFFNVLYWDFFYILYFVLYLLLLLIMVAYFTLVERKFMAMVQKSSGPDFAGVSGLFQPLVDALKLIFKEVMLPSLSNLFFFFLSPFLVFFLSMLSWAFLPLSFFGSLFNSELNLIWLLVISSFNVFSVFLSGWSSNCKYAMLGSLRSISQLISYEVCFGFLILPVMFISGSLSLNGIVYFQTFLGVWNFVYFMPSAFLVFICLLAETNSAPFDLPEAEAELVAGYNVEYSSMPFAYFFLGEYLNIFTMCMLFVLLYMQGWSSVFLSVFYSKLFLTSFCFLFNLIHTVFYKLFGLPLLVLFSFFNLNFLFLVYLLVYFLFWLKVFFLMCLFVWVSATLPSASFDFLMLFCWKYSLLFSISYFFFIFSFFYLFIFLSFHFFIM